MDVHPDDLDSKKFTLFILCVLLLLGLFFILQTAIRPSEQTGIPELEQQWHTPKTARAQTLQEKTIVGNCFICHMQLVPDPNVRQPRFAHQIIKLDHGKNDRCFNCHLIQDRNKYAADDGTGILHTHVELLCAKCHGLIFNDWFNGVHGLSQGLWSAKTESEKSTFTCTHCHDPHMPVFKFKEFTPPPDWPEKFIRHSVSDHSPDDTKKKNPSDQEKI